MKTVVIRSLEELCGWERPWRELTENLEYPEIFSTWEWLQSYVSHMFGPNRQLFVILVIDQDRCIAAAPMCIVQQSIKWMRIRSLQFIVSGTGETNSFYIHKYVHYMKALKEIFNVLHAHRHEWDCIDLYNIHSLDPVTGLIGQACGSDYDVFSHSSSITPYVNLERFHQGKLARSRIKAIERKERRLRNDLETRLEIHVPVEERTWEYLIDMHKERWAQSLFGVQETMRFYGDIISKFHELDGVHISYIEINGSVASAMLTFSHKSKVYLYITSFSQQYMEYGVGLILLNKVMEHYLQSGITEIDLMSGTQEYKFFWSDTVRVNNHIRLIERQSGNTWLKAYTLLQVNKDHLKSFLPKKAQHRRVGR